MPERRAPQQLRAQRTRRHLLAAAQRVFAQAGYPGATVDALAEAAGCSKGAYYFHFSAKEDVFLALIDDWTERQSQRLAAAADGGRPAEALLDLLDALYSFEASDGWEPRLLLEFWSQGERNPEVARRLGRAHRSWRRLLAQAFRRAQEAGPIAPAVAAEAAAEAALALHHGLVVQACLGAVTRASTRGRARAVLALLVGPKALRRAG